MTPFRSHGKGTLVLKGRFAGVRVERASGTSDPKRLADLKAMCRALAEAGRLDVLDDLARSRVRPLEVWQAYRSGSWSSLPTPAHAWPFTERFEQWRLGRAPHYQRDIRSAVAQLSSIDGSFTLGKLGDVLLRYRAHCETQGTGAMFNRVKGMVLGFLRDTVTRQHVLYQQCAAAPRLPESRKRLGDPQTPDQAKTIRALLVEPVGAAWWAMCCTGMGPDEFFGSKWRYEDGRLRVLGTKRAARDRYVPVIETVERSPLTQEQFQRALQRSGVGVRPYDARRTFAHWCDLAGVPEIRRELYLGHAVRGNLRTLYGAHESERFVEEDARKLKKVVGFVVGPRSPRSRKFNAPTRNRTENLLIKSQLLYQLSYRRGRAKHHRGGRPAQGARRTARPTRTDPAGDVPPDACSRAGGARPICWSADPVRVSAHWVRARSHWVVLLR
jgi:hypothetical protein